MSHFLAILALVATLACYASFVVDMIKYVKENRHDF